MFPITEDTFEQIWAYARTKHYWAKKQALLRCIATPVSQLLFFCSFLILTYGTVFEYSTGLLRSFFMKAPFLASHWQEFSPLLFGNGAGDSGKLMRMAGFLYGPALAAVVIMGILVTVLYHPIPPRCQETPQARDLWVLSRHIQAAGRKKPGNMFGFCGIFFGILSMSAILFFMLYNIRNPEIAARLRANAGQANLLFVLGALCAFLAYWVLNLPLQLVIRLACRTAVPRGFHEQIQEYCETADGPDEDEYDPESREDSHFPEST